MSVRERFSAVARRSIDASGSTGAIGIHFGELAVDESSPCSS